MITAYTYAFSYLITVILVSLYLLYLAHSQQKRNSTKCTIYKDVDSLSSGKPYDNNNEDLLLLQSAQRDSSKGTLTNMKNYQSVELTVEETKKNTINENAASLC